MDATMTMSASQLRDKVSEMWEIVMRHGVATERQDRADKARVQELESSISKCAIEMDIYESEYQQRLKSKGPQKPYRWIYPRYMYNCAAGKHADLSAELRNFRAEIRVLQSTEHVRMQALQAKLAVLRERLASITTAQQ